MPGQAFLCVDFTLSNSDSLRIAIFWVDTFLMQSEFVMNIIRRDRRPSTLRPSTPRALLFASLMLLLVGFPQLGAAEEMPPSANAERSGASAGHSAARADHQGKRGKRPKSSARKSRAKSKGKRPTGRPTGRPRAKKKVTVPVEVGVGPAFFALSNPYSGGEVLGGPLTEGQLFQYGVRIDIAAIITHEFVQKNPRLVPRKYKSMFKPGSEFRYTPGILALIPRDLIISPKLNDTGAYGANWELMALGIDLLSSSNANLNLGAGLLATYIYIDSELAEASTHFLRPGISLGLSAGAMLSDSFGLRIGWNSNFYIPQAIGGGILEMGEGDQSLWHIGEAYLQLRFRFPFTTTI